MYSFPSTSQIFAPSARATKNGSPSTFRKARTGELTPPGMCFCARLKSSEECEFNAKQTSNVHCRTSNAECQSFDTLHERVNLISRAVAGVARGKGRGVQH